MIALMLLSGLMIAFAVLARTEPLIANNHLRVAQARALADSAIERAIWALNATAANGGIDAPEAGISAAAPYDGRPLLRIGPAGGFTVRVTGVSPTEVIVDATGWYPTNDATKTLSRARRHLTAAVFKLTPTWARLPCALCVRGPLDVAGRVEIDGRPSADPGNDACGPKLGAATYRHPGASPDPGRAATTIQSPARIWGAADGNGTANEPGDYAQDLEPSLFEGGVLSDADLDLLRALARSNGTYYGPGFADGGQTYDPGAVWTGSITFSATRKVRSGLVFVDTAGGQEIPGLPSAQTPADFADVRLEGAFWSDTGPAQGVAGFQGWIVVNGKLTVSGDVKVKGLLYAVDDVTFRTGPGISTIEGQIVAANIRPLDSTTIVDAGGTSRITFDCNAVRAAPGLATTWTLKRGTYAEVTD
jgi:hypothetical protein